jgi:hypothetical protein
VKVRLETLNFLPGKQFHREACNYGKFWRFDDGSIYFPELKFFQSAIIYYRRSVGIIRRIFPESDSFGGDMKTFLLFLTILAILGCAAHVSNKPFPLEFADPVSVRECRLVGKYPGPYGYRFWGPPPVLGDFTYRSAVQAKEAGATHIYWREAFKGYYGETRIIGYAFDCSGVAMPKNYEDSALY